jgi:hypothetical protein
MGRKSFKAILFVAIALSVPCLALGLPLGEFDCITGNLSSDCELGTSQLSGTLENLEGGVVRLTLFNDGSEDLVVASLYLESSYLAGLTIGDTEGTKFSLGGAPPQLPGASQSFDIDLYATADPAPPENGIGPGESGIFDLVLADGATPGDLFSELRVGVHVIAFESGGSESFIAQPVPEPGAAMLIGLGLACTAAASRRRPGGRLSSRPTRAQASSARR